MKRSSGTAVVGAAEVDHQQPIPGIPGSISKYISISKRVFFAFHQSDRGKQSQSVPGMRKRS